MKYQRRETLKYKTKYKSLKYLFLSGKTEKQT